MSLSVAIAVAAVVLLVLLLGFERRRNRVGMLAVKTPLSGLFVLTAALLPHPAPLYGQVVLAALMLSLAGDVLLALGSRRAFRFGLVAFLTAHILYVVAFVPLASVNPVLGVGAAAAAIAAVVVYRRLRPYLGDMTRPVQAYILVISAMLVLAFGAAGRVDLSAPARVLIPAGALLFYVSDLFVARDRFVRAEFRNRLLGLPLYYGGQFTLALSTAVV